MDITELLGSNVTLEVVRSSGSKRLVVLSAGALKDFDGKKKLSMLVEMDGRQLSWIPNKISLKNLSDKYGKDTAAWLGKSVALEQGIINGKEAVIGKPL